MNPKKDLLKKKEKNPLIKELSKGTCRRCKGWVQGVYKDGLCHQCYYKEHGGY